MCTDNVLLSVKCARRSKENNSSNFFKHSKQKLYTKITQNAWIATQGK